MRVKRFLGCIVMVVIGTIGYSGENMRVADEFYAALNKGDNQKMVQILQRLSELGNPEAQAYLAYFYQEGIGVDRDLNKAVKLFQISANEGNAFGKVGMAAMYFNGTGVTRNYSRAMQLYTEALSAAKENMKLVDDTNLDASQYKKRLRARLIQVINSADYNIGFMYETGSGVMQDYAKAVEWYRPAAEQGLAVAQRRLGNMYLDGHGVPADYAMGATLLRQAATAKLASAQFDLAQLCFNGKGVTKNTEEAVQLYRLSAEQGYAPAQNALGRLHSIGLGVDQNYDVALAWFKKASDQGYAEAQYNIGVLYQDGSGVPQSDSEAAKWYGLAAEQDLASAQWNLAKLYYFGKGVTADRVMAGKWARRAANQGFAPAEYGLGVYFSSGEPARRNYAEAFRWLEAAAEQNYTPSQKILGDLYAHGIGTSQDYEKAAYWYGLAVKSGDPEAEKALAQIRDRPAAPVVFAAYEPVIIDDTPVIVDDVTVSDVWVVDEIDGTAERKEVVVKRTEGRPAEAGIPSRTVVVVDEHKLDWPMVRGAYRITSDELIGAYLNNELAADKTYRGKILETVGRVVKIAKGNFGYVFVVISPDGETYDDVFPINAQMRGGQDNALEGLRSGMEVYISGKCYGLQDDKEGVQSILLKDVVLLKY